MLLPKAAALLLVAIFGLSWAKASSSSKAAGFMRALIRTRYDQNYGPGNQKDDFESGEVFPPLLINKVISKMNLLNDNERFAVTPLLVFDIGAVLDELDSHAHDLKKILKMLILENRPTELRKQLGMLDDEHQGGFNDLLEPVKIHQANLGIFRKILDEYAVSGYRKSAVPKVDDLVKEVEDLGKKMSYLVSTNKKLWIEFNRISQL